MAQQRLFSQQYACELQHHSPQQTTPLQQRVGHIIRPEPQPPPPPAQPQAIFNDASRAWHRRCSANGLRGDAGEASTIRPESFLSSEPPSGSGGAVTKHGKGGSAQAIAGSTSTPSGTGQPSRSRTAPRVAGAHSAASACARRASTTAFRKTQCWVANSAESIPRSISRLSTA